MEQTAHILTVPGGGTLHCDWGLPTKQCLLTLPGAMPVTMTWRNQRDPAQRRGVARVSGTVRKHRPGAPLNGVILTLNVAI